MYIHVNLHIKPALLSSRSSHPKCGNGLLVCGYSLDLAALSLRRPLTEGQGMSLEQ
jgi:hypothetical protein